MSKSPDNAKKTPFILMDVILILTAGAILYFSKQPLSIAHACIIAILVMAGAFIAIIPWKIDARQSVSASEENEPGQLTDAENEILELKSEVDRLKKAEDELVTAIENIMDHVLAVSGAGLNSEQPAIVKQMERFRKACNELIHTAGLEYVLPEIDSKYTSETELVPEGLHTPAEGTRIVKVLSTGFSYCGKLHRKPIVLAEGMPMPEEFLPPTETEIPETKEVPPQSETNSWMEEQFFSVPEETVQPAPAEEIKEEESEQPIPAEEEKPQEAPKQAEPESTSWMDEQFFSAPEEPAKSTPDQEVAKEEVAPVESADSEQVAPAEEEKPEEAPKQTEPESTSWMEEQFFSVPEEPAEPTTNKEVAKEEAAPVESADSEQTAPAEEEKPEEAPKQTETESVFWMDEQFFSAPEEPAKSTPTQEVAKEESAPVESADSEQTAPVEEEKPEEAPKQTETESASWMEEQFFPKEESVKPAEPEPVTEEKSGEQEAANSQEPVAESKPTDEEPKQQNYTLDPFLVEAMETLPISDEINQSDKAEPAKSSETKEDKAKQNTIDSNATDFPL